jgi:pimeloyl-ACP methyl ester carboxylesterase
MKLILVLLALFSATPCWAKADPAVVHANANRAGPIAYKEGWYGTGPSRLHYVEAGAGPLVILYHGFPSFWYSWFDQMEMLKSRYRVVAVDALGAGGSAKPDALEPYRVERLAAQLDGLARHLQRGRFVLIGHDWGAALAFAYAQAYPDRLNAVIGMSAPSFNVFLDLVGSDPDQQRRSQYMRLFGTLTLQDIRQRGIAARIAQDSYKDLIASGALTAAEGQLFRTALADPETMNGGMNWYRANIPPFDRIASTDRWPADGRGIKVPALLITGDADQTFVPAFTQRMRQQTAGLQVVSLPGVGHWTSMQAPAAANAAILRFLRSARTRRRP